MRVSKMVRWTTALAGLLFAAACSDSSTGVATMAVDAADPTAVVTLEGEATFTIVPGAATKLDYKRFSLEIPANALCDIETSGYGRAVFDNACAAETAPQTFQVRWGTDDYGNVRIAFDRDARFAPGKLAAIMVRTPGTLKSSDAILWYDAQAGRWVDEGLYDAQQKSRVSKGGTLMARNLKHFSGYNIGAGIAEGDEVLDFLERTLSF